MLEISNDLKTCAYKARLNGILEVWDTLLFSGPSNVGAQDVVS